MENSSNTPVKEQLIDMERSVMEAFKTKDEQKFVRYFAQDYIGVAGDGVKDARGEIAGMKNLDLSHLSSKDFRVNFPTDDMAILTYSMVTQGKMKEQDISGSIFASTVYAKRDDRWQVVLHTESPAMK